MASCPAPPWRRAALLGVFAGMLAVFCLLAVSDFAVLQRLSWSRLVHRGASDVRGFAAEQGRLSILVGNSSSVGGQELAASFAQEPSEARSLRLSEIPERAGLPNRPRGGEGKRTFEPSKPGACLQFIHIPKTGGGTITQTYADKPADSRIDGWGLNNHAQRCDPKHRTAPNSNGAEFCQLPRQICRVIHTPPSFSRTIWETGFQMCDTFCTVRNPIDRLVSEWQYIGHRCDDDKFFPWVEERLDKVQHGDLYINECHFIPQYQFVFNFSEKEPPIQMCKHILRFENLSEDFEELMKAYNYDLQLSKHVHKKTVCDIKFPDDLVRKIRMVYAMDFGLFGYD